MAKTEEQREIDNAFAPVESALQRHADEEAGLAEIAGKVVFAWIEADGSLGMASIARDRATPKIRERIDDDHVDEALRELAAMRADDIFVVLRAANGDI